jgi:hypothetical protein
MWPLCEGGNNRLGLHARNLDAVSRVSSVGLWLLVCVFCMLGLVSASLTATVWPGGCSFNCGSLLCDCMHASAAIYIRWSLVTVIAVWRVLSSVAGRLA